MALPRKLKNFACFFDGVAHVGVVSEVTLPKLARKMDDYRGGGMNGPVKADMGMEAMEMEFTTGFDVQHFRQFGITKAAGTLLRFTGAWQREDSGEVTAVEVVARGRYHELDPGNAKAGDDAPVKVKANLSYYKLTVNGVVEVEIDLMNFVEVVGGTDRLAEQRAALGI